MSSEVLRHVLADPKMAHVLATATAASETSDDYRLGRRDWLGIHVVAFLILSWNAFAIDLARTPGRWWFWIPVAALALFLALHAGWVAITERKPAAAGDGTAVNQAASAP